MLNCYNGVKGKWGNMLDTSSNTIDSAQKTQMQSVLGQLHRNYSFGHNYAFVVICVLSQIGMNRTQNNIQDKGALQKQIAKGQTQFATMQQFMSLLEGNTQWDSSKKQAYWPPSFVENHGTQMKNFVNAFGQFFDNTSGPNTDPSTTAQDLTIDYTLPEATAHYPKGTKISIDPVNGRVECEKPGATSYSVDTTGDFSGILGKVTTYLNAVQTQIFGSDKYSMSDLTGTVPQCLAIAMANLQTTVDGGPKSFFIDCVSGSGSIQSFAGDVDSNPLITSASSLYSNYAGCTGINGTDMASTLDTAFQNESTANMNTVWQDMAGTMADWMSNKMNNQSSSTGSTAPSGAEWIASNGIPSMQDNFVPNPQTVKNAMQGLNETYSYVMNYSGPWEPDATQAVKNHINFYGKPRLNEGNWTGVQQVCSWIENDFTNWLYLGPGKNNPGYKAIASVSADMGDILQQEKDYKASFKNIGDPGLFNETQSSLSLGASTYQSQTQQNSASVQQDSSTLTSYDQIGQSIITAMNKAEQTIAGNLKSS